ncbi:MAG: zinc ribbon domain-containing protein [Candidatus Kapabacteria bacterium]|nr:zinc ribbon domain-containing protein [Candidatus Kapabacteria bacterium]
MPTYVYKCQDCNTKYEIFFKTKEIKEEVVCPSCNSKDAVKQVTAANVGGFSSSKSFDSLPSYPSCSTGTCSTGMCGLN